MLFVLTAFCINSKHSVGQAAHHFLQAGDLTQRNSTTFTPTGGHMLEISQRFLNISKTMATSQLQWEKCFIQVCLLDCRLLITFANSLNPDQA